MTAESASVSPSRRLSSRRSIGTVLLVLSLGVSVNASGSDVKQHKTHSSSSSVTHVLMVTAGRFSSNFRHFTVSGMLEGFVFILHCAATTGKTRCVRAKMLLLSAVASTRRAHQPPQSWLAGPSVAISAARCVLVYLKVPRASHCQHGSATCVVEWCEKTVSSNNHLLEGDSRLAVVVFVGCMSRPLEVAAYGFPSVVSF